jgi:hypothetical protein
LRKFFFHRFEGHREQRFGAETAVLKACQEGGSKSGTRIYSVQEVPNRRGFLQLRAESAEDD